MSRRAKVHYELNDVRKISEPSEEDIKKILRAADDIITLAGRNMLAKILKGSRDKKLLEKELDKNPSYGYYKELKMEEITTIIDWMIVNDYLNIDYFGRLPMIVFSPKGWDCYKPVYVEELYYLIALVDLCDCEELIELMKNTNRQVVKILLTKIGESRNISFIRFLRKWEIEEVKKVRIMINGTINKLKSV